MIKPLIIEPRDPMIFRDGKPFTAGAGARSLPFAPPSVIAGAMRTRLGSPNGRPFDKSKISALLEVEFAGPVLGYRKSDAPSWGLAFAAPADYLSYEREGMNPAKQVALRCVEEEGGCDLPEGLRRLEGAADRKVSSEMPVFWSWDSMSEWLTKKERNGFLPNGWGKLKRQRRVHVSMSTEFQTAVEGMLYSTEGLEFHGTREEATEFSLIAWYDCGKHQDLAAVNVPRVSHLGGESRTAFWDAKANEPGQPKCPIGEPPKGFRMILATPAVFEGGWKPGWLDAGNEGAPPGFEGKLKVRLNAAAVPRALPISGWDYKLEEAKPTRLMVPAGSVYFFDVMGSGDARELWMRSVCDVAQDRLDGFGRVLIGEA